MSALRKARWPVKFESLRHAEVGRKENKSTGRMAKHYVCAKCDCEFPAKEVSVDHINPVVPLTGFDSWDGIIARMFCETEGLQVLCHECHRTKTNREKEIRKQYK